MRKVLDVLPVTELMTLLVEDQAEAPWEKSVKLLVKRLTEPPVHPDVLMTGEAGW